MFHSFHILVFIRIICKLQGFFIYHCSWTILKDVNSPHVGMLYLSEIFTVRYFFRQIFFLLWYALIQLPTVAGIRLSGIHPISVILICYNPYSWSTSRWFAQRRTVSFATFTPKNSFQRANTRRLMKNLLRFNYFCFVLKVLNVLQLELMTVRHSDWCICNLDIPLHWLQWTIFCFPLWFKEQWHSAHGTIRSREADCDWWVMSNRINILSSRNYFIGTTFTKRNGKPISLLPTFPTHSFRE